MYRLIYEAPPLKFSVAVRSAQNVARYQILPVLAKCTAYAGVDSHECPCALHYYSHRISLSDCVQGGSRQMECGNCNKNILFLTYHDVSRNLFSFLPFLLFSKAFLYLNYFDIKSPLFTPVDFRMKPMYSFKDAILCRPVQVDRAARSDVVSGSIQHHFFCL